MPTHGFTEVALTKEQAYQLEVVSVAFMVAAPFYAHTRHSLGRLVFTRDIPTAATDGRHVIFNPDWFLKLKTSEAVFVFSHELDHLVCRHPTRAKHYDAQGTVRSKPYEHGFANTVMDYVINQNLIDTGVGSPPMDALLHPQVTGADLWEDVYERLWVDPPKQPPRRPTGTPSAEGQGQGDDAQQPTQSSQPPPSTMPRPKGAKPADPSQIPGPFDQLLPPPIDPETGVEDLPDESEFKEAIARAAAVAKAMGKMPGHLQRMVDELLEPVVDWRDRLRMLTTGKIGSRGETWNRPNRRRLALNPIVVMPGRRGVGAETVVVAVDTSGSIGERELSAFFAEVSGILNDCKPHRIIVVGCDAAISQIDEVTSLDELEGLRAKGIGGGGGTDFRPVFEKCAEEDWKPETLIYMTDMLGVFPNELPAYPVIWCSTSKGIEAPFGETVEIEL